jgi:molybdopterin converting factor small subunit
MQVRLSGTLLRFVNYDNELTCDARTVGDALRTLVDHHPRLAPVIFDGDGQLRTLHALFLNNEQMSSGDLSRALKDDDVLEIVTAIAGG